MGNHQHIVQNGYIQNGKLVNKIGIFKMGKTSTLPPKQMEDQPWQRLVGPDEKMYQESELQQKIPNNLGNSILEPRNANFFQSTRKRKRFWVLRIPNKMMVCLLIQNTSNHLGWLAWCCQAKPGDPLITTDLGNCCSHHFSSTINRRQLFDSKNDRI